MISDDRFLTALGIDPNNKSNILEVSEKTGIPIADLNYYSKKNILPTGRDLEIICQFANISSKTLQFRMGIFSKRTIEELTTANNISDLYLDSEIGIDNDTKKSLPITILETFYGKLYQGDCLDLLQMLDSDSIDLIFADPPFNLNKYYPSEVDDNLAEREYIKWCESWAFQCARVLKKGGAFFIWNLPKWNTYISSYLNNFLTFQHWISVDIKYRLPIKGRLYPSHYSLLYYTKGYKPKVFHPDRLPMRVCPKCTGDLNDYGGYKNKMNPLGINLADVWYDIPPVRHKKYKRRNAANELPIKLLDRIIEMATDEGDIVFDPFGGSGTTYVVSELKKRKWLGIEIGPITDIVARFQSIGQDKEYLERLRANLNALFPDEVLAKRIKKGLWTSATLRKEDPQIAIKFDNPLPENYDN